MIVQLVLQCNGRNDGVAARIGLLQNKTQITFTFIQRIYLLQNIISPVFCVCVYIYFLVLGLLLNVI